MPLLTTGRSQKYVIGEHGYHNILISKYLNPNEACGLTTNVYSLSLNVNGGGASDITFAVSSDMLWRDVFTAIGNAVTLRSATLTVTATPASNTWSFASNTYGSTSSLVVANGSTGAGGGFLTQLTAKGIVNAIQTTVAGVNDVPTSGYATISNTGSLGAFTSTTVPGLATHVDYDLNITVDGTLRTLATISITNTSTWAQIAAAIQTSLRTATGSTETVVIDANNKIRVTSATTKEASTVLIAAGTGAGVGGDLLAAINALGATYVAHLDTPVGGTDNVVFTVGVGRASRSTVEIFDSTGVIKSNGVQAVPNDTAGTVTVSDGTTVLNQGDIILVKPPSA